MKIKILTIVLCVLPFFASAKVNLVRVIKSERKMLLIESGKILKEYHIALGANPSGHKQQEGDERTPEGRYTLDYINEQSSYHRSMHLSYPNANDRANAKQKGVSPGGDIMIHGQPNGFGAMANLTQLTDWTNGCIALTNSEMDEFLKLVAVGTTIEVVW